MNRENIEEEARLWISKEQEGLNLSSSKKFSSWLNSSFTHKEIYQEEREFRSLLNNIPDFYINNAEKETLSDIKRDKFIKKIKKIVSIAACFILIFFTFNKDENKYINSINSKHKIMQNIILPDNSKITLDAKSKIDILYSADKREVILKKGKGIFDVSSNKSRPFFVKSDNILVQVIGTKFEVVKQKEKINISVLEGKVNIKYGKEKSKILALLEKGDILEISKLGKIKKLYKKDIEKIAIWKNKKLLFKNTPLDEVLNTFSKYIKKEIVIKLNNKDNYPITGEFTTEEFDKFLELLPLIYPIKIDMNSKNRIVFKNNS